MQPRAALVMLLRKAAQFAFNCILRKAGSNVAQQADFAHLLQRALCAAAAHGRLPVVDRLIQEGADTEWRNMVRTQSIS